jgi:hypothetical protein
MDQTETEMGEAPKVETEAIYAWALDDGVDDLPTQRLTPRRITALGIAASLVVIAVSGAVALLVIHNVNHPVAQARSSPIVETVARPAPPPTVTVTAAAPTAPLPSPAPSNNAANEASFVSAVFATIPTFRNPRWPSHRHAANRGGLPGVPGDGSGSVEADTGHGLYLLPAGGLQHVRDGARICPADVGLHGLRHDPFVPTERCHLTCGRASVSRQVNASRVH